MRKEDAIVGMLEAEPALGFIQPFLAAHPEAQLFLVGGAVRDALMGRSARRMDFDFVIRGLAAQELEAWFRSRGTINLVGEHFGVFKFMPASFSHKVIPFIDIALPRTEAVAHGGAGGYRDVDVQSDPALPMQQDLARRDFTVNAMAFELRRKKLIDPFKGRRDLRSKRIRAVGDPAKRFEEDLTRLLRAIRFACELNFSIERKTWKALRAMIPAINRERTEGGKRVFVVPREMVGEELAKALHANPMRAIHELVKSGGMEELLPAVARLIHSDKAYLHPLKRTPSLTSLTLSLTLLLRSLSRDQAALAIRFAGLDRLPEDTPLRVETPTVLWLIDHLRMPPSTHAIDGLPASEFERAFMNPRGDLLLTCLRATGECRTADTIEHRRTRIEERWLVDHDETIAPLLSGNDILATGVPAGPKVRLWLDAIRDLQLDGELMTREAALRWVKNYVNKPKASG